MSSRSLIRIMSAGFLTAVLSYSCSSSKLAPSAVPAHAYKTDYKPASLPGVTAEYTLLTPNATPHGIVLGPNGSVFFGEEYGHVIGRVTPQGTVQEVPIAAFPAELTFDTSDNLWFTEPLLQAYVVKLAPSFQTTVYTIPSAGAAPPFPTGIVAQPAPSLAVWFTNPGTNTIGRIDGAGNISTFNAPGSPTGIALGSDSAFYFTELNGDAIGRMDFNGNLTNQYAVPTLSNLPTGITAGPSASIWFTENGCLVKGPADCVYGKIGRLQGGAITEFDAQSDPVSIILGDDGNLWFTASFANKIGRITPAGVVSLYPVPTSNSQPLDITNGPNRTIWFTERAAGKIGVLSY